MCWAHWQSKNERFLGGGAAGSMLSPEGRVVALAELVVLGRRSRGFLALRGFLADGTARAKPMAVVPMLIPYASFGQVPMRFR